MEPVYGSAFYRAAHYPRDTSRREVLLYICLGNWNAAIEKCLLLSLLLIALGALYLWGMHCLGDLLGKIVGSIFIGDDYI
jgi:hypothetical protein